MNFLRQWARARLTSNFTAVNQFHSSAVLSGGLSRKEILSTAVKKDDGAQGESSIDIDSLVSSDTKTTFFNVFPNKNTSEQLFNGTPFKELHIIHIRCSKNNTIVNLTDHKGVNIFINSCGKEGFKNCRKGTNIAGQATALSLAAKCLERGVDTVRVVVRGLGAGRMSSVKGLQMAGLNVVSITDATRVTYTPCRPRKQRRL